MKQGKVYVKGSDIYLFAGKQEGMLIGNFCDVCDDL